MWKEFGINTIKRVPDCKSFEVFVYDMSLPTASSIKMESHLHKNFQFTCSGRLTINNSHNTLWWLPIAWSAKSKSPNKVLAPFPASGPAYLLSSTAATPSPKFTFQGHQIAGNFWNKVERFLFQCVWACWAPPISPSLGFCNLQVSVPGSFL